MAQCPVPDMGGAVNYGTMTKYGKSGGFFHPINAEATAKMDAEWERIVAEGTEKKAGDLENVSEKRSFRLHCAPTAPSGRLSRGPLSTWQNSRRPQ